MKDRSTLVWLRRDLRLDDNAALFHALSHNSDVQPLFIFDTDILDKLDDKRDRRVEFIHNALQTMQQQLVEMGSSLLVIKGRPVEVFKKLVDAYLVSAVYTNHDYEPYAAKRDGSVAALLKEHDIPFHSYCDQVIFEKSDVVKDDGKPYTVFTPYSRKWKTLLSKRGIPYYDTSKHFANFKRTAAHHFPSLGEIGFHPANTQLPPVNIGEAALRDYEAKRNIPSLEATSRLGVHLRFGTMGIRQMVKHAMQHSETFLNELIWREFFMMILWHFPYVEKSAFKPAYDNIQWRNNEEEFRAWCKGETGYPLVDAGMRELERTGFMHNRVRMVAAGFLCKHLLIDWRWGEAWFAAKLLDYELSSNNGNWQWAAGSGCDAAPYFRVFNPSEQLKKFDPDLAYVHKWVPEYGTSRYPHPIVEHPFARQRALELYGKTLKKDR